MLENCYFTIKEKEKIHMAIPCSEITRAITAYSNRFSDSDIQSLQPLLEAITLSHDITSRTCFPGHVTTSAVIMDDKRRVLYIRHKTLKAWLLPGGHCEETDHSLIEAGLREAFEETGIPPEKLQPILPKNVPIDIDLHDIPDNPVKGEPPHWHADFRFAFRLESFAKVTIQEEEVTGHAWLTLEQMPMRRLADRLRNLVETPG